MIKTCLLTLLLLASSAHAGINTIATVKHYSSNAEEKELQFFVKSFILPNKDLIMIYRQRIRRFNPITGQVIWDFDVKKDIKISDRFTSGPIGDIQFSADNKILAIRLESYIRLYALEDGRLLNETFVPDFQVDHSLPLLQISKEWLMLWNQKNIIVYKMPPPPKSDLVTRFLSFVHTSAPEPLALAYRWKAIQHEGEGFYNSLDKFNDVHITHDQRQVVARNSIGLQKWSLATGKLIYDSFKMYPSFDAFGREVSGNGEYVCYCSDRGLDISGPYTSATIKPKNIELRHITPVHIVNVRYGYNPRPCQHTPDRNLVATWQPNTLRDFGFELHVYNMKGGQYLNIIEPDAKSVKDVIVSSDSQRLVTLDALGRLRVYDIRLQKLLTQTQETSTDKLMAIDKTGHFLLMSDTVRSRLIVKEIK